MDTRSQSAHPPSQPPQSKETFEEGLQVPQEKEGLYSRISRLETHLSQFLHDNLALHGQCDTLTARVRFLDNSIELHLFSILRVVSASNKCKKRRLDACPKHSQFCGQQRLLLKSPEKACEVSHRPSATLPRC